MKTIGEIAKVGAGQGAPQDASAFSNDGMPFVRAGSLEFLCKGASLNKLERINERQAKIHKLKLYPSGTILFAKSGMSAVQNRVFILPKPAHVVSHLATVEVKDGVDSKFLSYFWQNFKTSRLIQDPSYPSISLEAVENVEIELPKPDEQKRIAAILDKADRLRRQRRFAQTLADSFLQSVFVKMFGDPVSNPMNWESNKLGKYTSLVSSGSTPLGGETVYQRKGIRFIRSQNVLMNEFDFSDIAFIDEKIYQSMKRTQVKRNDVLINITGASIGRVACYKENMIANVNQHVCIIRLADKNLLPDFLAWQLSMPFYQKTVISSQSGATRQAFNFDQIKDFTVIKPPRPLQEKFAAIVQKFERVRRQQREATRQAEHLFQTLLHRAFRGEL